MSVQLTSNALTEGASISQLVSVLDLACLVLPGPAPSSAAQATYNEPARREFSIVDSSLWPKDI
jgi:hypothetical protein